MTKYDGIGYQGYRALRIKEGLSPGSIEDRGNERYSVYWGRMHLIDHETQQLARGEMKFGRGKFTTAIQRGRNEGGADFRIYAEIIVSSEQATYEFERKIAGIISNRNVAGSQGQQELYSIKDADLFDIVKQAAEYMETSTSHWIQEVNVYPNDKPVVVPFVRQAHKNQVHQDVMEGLLVFG